MILKGNQRGGGQQLAAHLMNTFDNDSVEIVDVRGAVAQDLSGAFAEWGAQGRATKIEKKYYYSLSLSPDPAQGHLTDEQYFDLIARVERSLSLVGQPRAIVFHEKRDDKGVLRHHCHAVWSRVDTSGPKIKAVDIPYDRFKLQTVARQFCRDHRLELPARMRQDKSPAPRDDFNMHAREDLGERQQKERTGISKEERAAIIAGCWTATSNGAAFVKAMEDKNYYLARGDSRDYVVIDLHGEVHSLSRQLSGVAKTKELRERLSDFPPAKQRSVEEAQNLVAEKRKEAIRRAVAPKEATQSEAERRRQELEERQKQRRDVLDLMRANLLDRHAMERGKLEEAQQAQTEGVLTARAQNQPRGVMGFLARVTGIQLVIDVRHKHQDKVRAADHVRQTVALRRTHDRELRDMDRRDRELARLETRENRSAETALRREAFQMVLRGKPPQRAVSADFEKAAALPRAAGMAGGKGLSTTFGDYAANAIRKGELRAAFERAASGKSAASDDNAAGDRAPANPDSANEAARTRDQVRARRPRTGPDPDRDRER